MPEWFTDEYLGIEVEQYIGLGVLAVVATLLHFALLRVIALVVRRRYAGEDLTFWDRERRLLNRSILLLAVGVTLLVGFPILDFDPDVENAVNQVTSLIAAVAIILVAFRGIDIFVDVLARRASETETMLDDSLVPLLRTSLRLFVMIVGILFVLQNLDVNVSSLVAGLGLGGLAIALAAQDTVRNLLGGLTIFADKPFEVGD